MIKSKKIVIFLISTLCILLICAGVFFSIRMHSNNKITFTISNTLPDGEGKKARVILLGGQSNASGCSGDNYLKINLSHSKYSEYKNGYKNIYINYLSGAKRSQGFVKCATNQGELANGFGPELGLADKLNELYPNETFYIIKCAWGGTNLYEQWLSPSSKGPTGILYKEFVEYVNTSIRYLVSKNYDVEIEGMCWMQGESDSFSIKNATNYQTHLANFVKDIRKEFSNYSSPDGIAFVDAYIADNPIYWVHYDLVNQSKDKVAKLSSLNAIVDTIGEGLTCATEPYDSPDLAHYDSLSEIKLGHLFAEELSNFM